jgi:ubiquinone/menaquinone biosynthesis C-methylase UbiE
VNTFPTETDSSLHKLYTDLSWVYDLIYLRIFDYEEQYKLIKSSLQKNDVETILEVGCGSGYLMTILEEKGYKVTGLDLSHHMLEIARKKVKGELIKQDMRNIKTERLFDAIVCLGRAFTYMSTNEDASLALKSFYNNLEDGGILLFDNFEERMFHPEGHFDWQETIYDYDDLRIIRRYKNRDYDPEYLTWIVDWEYIIEKDEKRQFIEDHAKLRQFRWHELKQELLDAGFKNPRIIDEPSFTVIAEKKS